MRRLPGRILRSAIRRLAGTITHVATEQPVVALTFDDGPDPVATPALLKVLEAHGAKATFFMTGEHAAAYPEIVAAVRNAGHAIGNHSWDHPSFPLISGSERRNQIKRGAGIQNGAGTLMFRPPYGHQSAASQMDAWLAGHKVITWNVCVPDWEDHDGEWFADFALQRVKPGSIVLMHDGLVDFLGEGCSDRRATLDAVGRILAALSGRFEFVTVPDLLRRGKPVRVNWWMRPDVGFLNQLERKSGTARRYETPGGVDAWLGFNR
jgi:peptidoglycan-N-acetylglucosamine deacetylase